MSAIRSASACGFALAAALLLLPQRTDAAEGVQASSVLELFTSQGCSSCPPADALFQKFTARDDLVALTFNVDYWDHLGWRDTLGSPDNTARQMAYSRARGDGRVYTPQVVVSGLKHAVGSREQDIEDAIARSRKALAERRVGVLLSTEGDALIVNVKGQPTGAKPAKGTVWLALYESAVTVAVQRGENHGRDLVYYNVVRSFTPVGQWMGEPLTLRLPKQHLVKDGHDGCAVLLQLDSAGPVVGAASLKIKQLP
ncbi:MAG: DUF1223 domain-containing protein [Pseudomonadota bacterium]|nr:DUF1223 domain-containing protein [Pseudomonadota bacterium]